MTQIPLEEKPVIIGNSNYELEGRYGYKALGFDPENIPKLFNAENLSVSKMGNNKNRPNVQCKQTLTAVFAAGDIVRGASLVVWAIRDGRDAATQIEKYLKSIELRKE